MAGEMGSVAETLGKTLLWSDLGGGELVLALIVGLVLLAFALPARLSGREVDEGTRRGEQAARLSHR